MPTFSFFLYLLLLAALYFFKLVYIGWFAGYLFWAAVAIPPVLLLFSLRSMLSLRASLAAPEIVTRGAEQNMEIRFETKALLPLSRVSVTVSIRNRYTGEEVRKRLHLLSLSEGSAACPLPTAFCGALDCRIEGLECCDLLELVRIKQKPNAALRCTVVPEPIEAERAPKLDAVLNAAPVLVPKYGGGYSEEHELRPYRQGDAVKSIHWKVSSKVDSPIVREPLIAANSEIYIVLDRPGEDDRGLESLYWLSLALCQRELKHTIVSRELYPVADERGALDALRAILLQPMAKPCIFDPANARCIFHVDGGEVRL